MRKHDYRSVPDTDKITDTERYNELREVLINSERPSEYFKELKRSGKTKEKYPELFALTDVKQNQRYHQEGDVWTHTMLVLDQAALRKGNTAFPLGFMISALCHDLGKAVSTVETDGTVHSYGHELSGVPLAQKFLLTFSNDEILNEYVLNMVRWHMEPNIIANARAKLKSSNKMFYRSYEPSDLIQLAVCDGLGKIPADSSNEAFLNERLEIYDHIMARPYVTETDIIENEIADSELMPEVLDHALKLRLAGIDKDNALIQVRGFARKLRERRNTENEYR